MPIITKYIDYECAGLIKKRGLRIPEKIAKKISYSFRRNRIN